MISFYLFWYFIFFLLFVVFIINVHKIGGGGAYPGQRGEQNICPDTNALIGQNKGGATPPPPPPPPHGSTTAQYDHV